MSASPAAEPADASSAKEKSQESLDGLAASFEEAERRLAALGLSDLGLDGAERSDDRATDKPDADAEPKAGGLARDGELSKKKLANRRAERCTVACRALASMRRSAEGLCRMVGDEDPRCESVNERAERARRTVARVCPACASAEAARDNEPKR